MADETIERVAGKSSWLLTEYTGEPIRYFFGVARRVFLESTRRKERLCLPEDIVYNDSFDESREILDSCLSNSLRRLPESERKFILNYYKGAKTEKIQRHRRMCRWLDLSPEALRVRAFRIRRKLKVFITQELKIVNANNRNSEIRAVIAITMRERVS